MKRSTPLRPGRPLERRKRLKAKTPIRERNPKRAAERERENFGKHAKFVRTLPCLLCGGPSEAAHVKSRGAGGKAEANIVNLCAWHHRLGPKHLHSGSVERFDREWGTDLRAQAEELWRDSPVKKDAA